MNLTGDHAAPLACLDVIWRDTGPGKGEMDLVVTNLGEGTLRDFALAYTSITRTVLPSDCEGAHLVKRRANYHEYRPAADFELAPGASWRFTEKSLSRVAGHANDGPKSAGLVLSGDRVIDIPVSMMQRTAPDDRPLRQLPSPAPDVPLGLLPWPNRMAVDEWRDGPVRLALAPDTPAADRAIAVSVGDLARRLFPTLPDVFVPLAGDQVLNIEVRDDPDQQDEGYALRFASGSITIYRSNEKGLRHALVSLAQMAVAARRRPDRYRFPLSGEITDAPRCAWRGSHLDVARQIVPMDTVTRFVDILAWHKMNVFHWHLSDDEAWRIEIKALPQLTATGATVGRDLPVLPQLGHRMSGETGFYTQDEVRALVGHAAAVGVEVMPEIDVPGHCEALLATLPHLRDPDEPESYWSVQGYPNNALNPGVPATYDILSIVFDELSDLFPFGVFHVGGDEVADGAWLKSPLAQDLMRREGLSGTHELQSHFLRRIQEMLAQRGKVTGAWEEAAHGAGLDRDQALLFSWTTAEKAAELVADGYDVINMPGQAYYLDMAQSEAWDEPGASWAGTTPPEKTYEFEAISDVPSTSGAAVRGVQAAIWCEHVTSRQRMNHMAFPRLSAIAEAGWTWPEAKDWDRFCATSGLMPVL